VTRVLLPLLCLLLASPVAAEELRGHIEQVGTRARLRTARGTILLTDSHATRQALTFAGSKLEVVLSGERQRGVFAPTQLLSPVRGEARGRLEATEDGHRFDSDEGQALDVLNTNPVLALAQGERVLLDVWTFESGLWVVAVEGKTTAALTVLRSSPQFVSTPSGYIRSSRTVWILDHRDGYTRVRYGDTTGWAVADEIERVAPPEPAPKASTPTRGIRDLLPGYGEE